MINADFFDKAKKCLQGSQPFTIYKKPSPSAKTSALIHGCFQKDYTLYTTTDFTESGFVMAPFNLNERKAILFPTNKSEFHYISLAIDKLPTPNTKEGFVEKAALKQKHMNLVCGAIKAIKNGSLEKVVLSRKINCHSSSDALHIFKQLLFSYPDAFVYCWYHPKIGLWLGATPESLLKVSGQTLKTVSLAGTRSVTEKPEPQWTLKETEEQRYVTDFIKDTLQGKVTDLYIGKTKTIRAGNLWHLKNNISGRLAEKEQLGEILKAIHPTPAVCGFPKEEAKEFIRNKENYNREFYAGFLGELNLAQSPEPSTLSSELFVNLRCMQQENNQARIYVGGGIVKDSSPEKEWEETVHKSRTILDVI